MPLYSLSGYQDTREEEDAAPGQRCWCCDRPAIRYCAGCRVALCRKHVRTATVNGKKTTVCPDHTKGV